MTYLTPLVPNSEGLGAPNEYIEVNSSDGQLILNGLKYIRDHREPKAKIFDVAPSPRPANVSLPEGWNDTEVNLVSRPLSSPRSQGVGNLQYPQDTLMTEASSSASTHANQGRVYYGSVHQSAYTFPQSLQTTQGYYGSDAYSQGMQQGSSSSYPPTTSSGQYAYPNPSSTDTKMAGRKEDNEEDELEVSQRKEDSSRSHNHVVDVRRIKRSWHKDQFAFKDRKGKTRITEQDDWTEIVDQGQRAWQYFHYICYDKIF
jgi:hypothetical protein